MELLALTLANLFFLAGLAGTLLPVLPGTPLIFAGMLLYGLLTEFETLGFYFFILQGVTAALTFLTDHIATAIGTKRYGGSKKASWGAALGTLLGAVLLGLPGLIFGAFLGAVAAELIGGKRSEQALKAGIGALLGFLGSIIVKLSISLAMITWFYIRIF